MNKPTPEKYGYYVSTSFDDAQGWTIEGGEDKYYEDLQRWESMAVPVNILDNYSAGWLSPQGKYYALNGMYPDLIHSEIAATLFQEEEIRKELVYEKDYEYEKNPDFILEQNGWVKIHGSSICFDGWNLHNRGKKNIAMTEIQKSMIYEYGQICCKGRLRLGYRQDTISAALFNITELPMLQKYFELI